MGTIRSKKADNSTELELLSGWQVSSFPPGNRGAGTAGEPTHQRRSKMNFKTLTGATFAASLAFAPLAHAEIVIGLIAPLTGPVAAYGDQVKNGAQVAVDQINKNGGILGEQVVLKLADDAGEPKQGVSAANQIVGEGIRFVVGPVTSGVAMPASDVLAENGVLMVTPTATTPDLTKRGLATILRTCGHLKIFRILGVQ
jgi:branched-chain amino acid transport system substrate-binding protein